MVFILYHEMENFEKREGLNNLKMKRCFFVIA